MASFPVVLLSTGIALVLKDSSSLPLYRRGISNDQDDKLTILILIALWYLSSALSATGIWWHLFFAWRIFIVIATSLSWWSQQRRSILPGTNHHQFVPHALLGGLWAALVVEQVVVVLLLGSSHHYNQQLLPILTLVAVTLTLSFRPRRHNVSNYNNHDARTWYEWTAPQVDEWVRVTLSLPPMEYNCNHYNGNQLTGRDLPLVLTTVPAVQSAFGLPTLGQACQLYRALQDMMQRYPYPYSQYATNGWLEQHDRQMYQQPPQAQPYAWSTSQSRMANTSSPVDAHDMPSTHRRNTNTIPPQQYPPSSVEKDHHHMELSSMERGTTDSNDNDLLRLSLPEMAAVLSSSSGLVPRPEKLPDDKAPPATPINSLPPHIRDIVQRKPHLLQQVLGNRRHHEHRGLLSAVDEHDDDDGMQTHYRSI